MNTCRICGNPDGNRDFVAREMMFGLRHPFDYFQCGRCECLQIREFPADMAPYYPANYYSMEAELPGPKGLPLDAWRRLDSRFRLGVCNYGHTKRREIFDWLRESGAGYDSEILDVGCGRGKLLHEFHLDGFRKLTGLDPFIAHDLSYPNGIRIHKRELFDHQGSYQLIMMHHSFEHMPDQLRTLEAASRLLRPGGTLLIRIPVVSSFVWREYGTDWYQLDAPRHFYLHSRKSVSVIAERAGFRVDKVVFDSKAAQFWGSEQYRNDIPHRSPRSYGENPKGSMFTPGRIREFARRSRELNRAEDGDAACFYLRRKEAPDAD
ncbi:MAG: Class SAM-dependent methyltransferase [Fibrobacteres bacterium]|nr:Class SAM-dependent methyltransferase [Fibrobacterota bacterium]